MKKIYLLALITLMSVSVMAQKERAVLKFGIKAGVNFASQTIKSGDIDEKSAYETSFHILGFADCPLSSSFSIQPGLALSGKGAKLDYSSSISGGGFTFNSSAKGDINVMYLEVPVNGVYKTKNIYFGAGPYFAYAISGKKDYVISASNGQGNNQTIAEKGNLSFGNDRNNDDYKSTDFGINILLGYQFAKGFNIGANYGLGLSNIAPSPQNGEEGKNRVISISIGYSL